jgi:hypothetical protein
MVINMVYTIINIKVCVWEGRKGYMLEYVDSGGYNQKRFIDIYSELGIHITDSLNDIIASCNICNYNHCMFLANGVDLTDAL